MKDIKDVLQRVVERSEMQNQIQVEEMRAKLFELGYSVVTTEWLNAVVHHQDPMSIHRLIKEERE
jgi:hypothetical protein